jgi:hypothetical protein
MRPCMFSATHCHSQQFILPHLLSVPGFARCAFVGPAVRQSGAVGLSLLFLVCWHVPLVCYLHDVAYLQSSLSHVPGFNFCIRLFFLAISCCPLCSFTPLSSRTCFVSIFLYSSVCCIIHAVMLSDRCSSTCRSGRASTARGEEGHCFWSISCDEIILSVESKGRTGITIAANATTRLSMLSPSPFPLFPFAPPAILSFEIPAHLCLTFSTLLLPVRNDLQGFFRLSSLGPLFLADVTSDAGSRA